jgi:hypothetical protein
MEFSSFRFSIIPLKKMQHLPPIVIECPTCGERYLVSREPNTPSDKAIFYSDGYYTDEFIWRTPGIIGCVTCELGFVPQNGKIVATPEWDEFYRDWSHIKQAQPPASGALVLELRARRNMETAIEKTLRKELWYSALHTEAGRALFSNNAKFRNFWNESLERFDELLDPSNDEERLLKAEVNRQLGRFEQCLSIIGLLQGKIPDAISTEAQKKSSTVVLV